MTEESLNIHTIARAQYDQALAYIEDIEAWNGFADWLISPERIVSVTLPVVMDSDARTVANAFGLTAYPYFVFVDSEGNVVTRLTGGMTAENIDTLITALAEV